VVRLSDFFLSTRVEVCRGAKPQFFVQFDDARIGVKTRKSQGSESSQAPGEGSIPFSRFFLVLAAGLPASDTEARDKQSDSRQGAKSAWLRIGRKHQ